MWNGVLSKETVKAPLTQAPALDCSREAQESVALSDQRAADGGVPGAGRGLDYWYIHDGQIFVSPSAPKRFLPRPDEKLAKRGDHRSRGGGLQVSR